MTWIPRHGESQEPTLLRRAGRSGRGSKSGSQGSWPTRNCGARRKCGRYG